MLDDRQAVLELLNATDARAVFHEVLVQSTTVAAHGGYAMAGEGVCDVLRRRE